METILESRTATIVIGSDRPFTIIGVMSGQDENCGASIQANGPTQLGAVSDDAVAARS